FGGTKLDLTQCQLAPGNNYLEMIAIFGGSTLIVPNDWNVKVESFNAFGGFADKRRNLNIDISKTLVIKGATVFGGGELKSY
ncbi:MAG TPA: LiaF-related protein, partial [Lentimicrobium sp.]|nr:LiaF-related protein [Lentimicrobium sp.]